MVSGYMIVMIALHGNRDYVEKVLDDGCPCLCGDQQDDAGVFSKFAAERIAVTLRKSWLSPHVAVEVVRVVPKANTKAVK